MSSLRREKIICKGFHARLFTKKGFSKYIQIKALLYFPLSWKMKGQFIFAFAALLVIASLITEGDCFAPIGRAPIGRKVIY